MGSMFDLFKDIEPAIPRIVHQVGQAEGSSKATTKAVPVRPHLTVMKPVEPMKFKAYTISTRGKGGEIKQHSMIDRTGRSLEQVRAVLSQQFTDRLINVELNK